jgi:hypothetical protein
VANLPKGKLKLLFGLKPKTPDPVPESALDPSVNQVRAPSGNKLTRVNSKRFRHVADSKKTTQICLITVRRMCFNNSKDQDKI